MTHPLTSADFSIFYQKLAIFVILGNKGKSCIKQFVILLTLIEFKVFIINVVPVLMMSALLATPGLFEVTLYYIQKVVTTIANARVELCLTWLYRDYIVMR